MVVRQVTLRPTRGPAIPDVAPDPEIGSFAKGSTVPTRGRSALYLSLSGDIANVTGMMAERREAALIYRDAT